MKTLNRFELIGRLGKEPEFKSLNNGGMLGSFSIATTKPKQDNGSWIDVPVWHYITFWGDFAQRIEKIKLQKGELVFVEGEIKTNEYEVNGERKTKIELCAYRIDRLSSKSKSGHEVIQEEVRENESEDLPF